MTKLRSVVVRIGMIFGAAVGLGILPGQALAAGASNTFTITQLGPREMGTDFVVTPSITSPVNCSFSTVVRVLSTAQNYQAIVASMLTAFSQQKTVRVWVTQCDTDGANIIIAAWVDK